MKDYKKILEGVVNIINTTEKSDIGFANICSYIGESCPELAESEDEKIRKELIKHLKEGAEGYEPAGDSSDYQRWLAWLEKQGEQKPAIEMKSAEESLGIDSDTYNKIVDECIYGEQKPADKVEPKFHEGDWTVSNLDGKARQISEVHFDEHNNYYVVNGMPVNLEEYDRRHHLWSIKDAKDGDVLVNWNNTAFIFKVIEDETVKFHIAYNKKWDAIKIPSTKLSHLGLPEPQFEFHPATKEQRDTLMKAMADAGYTFDFEKKELKKIEQKAWSEEGEELMKWSIINLTELKDRFGEEYGKVGDCINWLKSLRPQNRWKPSDEQMKALHDALSLAKNCGEEYAFDLRTLFEQLKKLREE